MGKKEDITQPMASQCILHILFGLLCQLFSSEIFHTQIVTFFSFHLGALGETEFLVGLHFYLE